MNERWINSADNWYIPIGVFSFIVIIGAILGFLNGWKTSTYFFSWNIVALIPTVLLMDKIKSILFEIEFVKKFFKKEIIEQYGSFFILIFVLILVNILAFIFYWFFRSKLKRSMKINKINKQSNYFVRWTGMGVGVITALPIAIFATQIASLTSEDGIFLKFNGYFSKTLTLGKEKSFTIKQKKDLKVLMEWIKYESKEVYEIF